VQPPAEQVPACGPTGGLRQQNPPGPGTVVPSGVGAAGGSVGRVSRRPTAGWPHPPLVILAPAGVAVLVVAVLVVAVIEVRAVGYAFTLAGLSPQWAATVSLLSLLGSGVNLPVAHLTSEESQIDYVPVHRLGVVYLVPVGRPGRIVVAVNVGGAVVPTIVSTYLLVHTEALVTVASVAVVVHLTARPVQSRGVVVPMIVPPVAAAIVAALIGFRGEVAALAYIAGTLGTLIGADLANVRSFRWLQARVLSIGGGGTFDGVFISGVLAVLLAHSCEGPGPCGPPGAETRISSRASRRDARVQP
jgi:uncharacterized membrane protein